MSTDPLAGRVESRVKRLSLTVIGSIAVLLGLLWTVSIVLNAIRYSSQKTLDVRGLIIGNVSTPEFTRNLPEINDAWYESVGIVIDHPPAAVRWFLWAELAAGGLIVIGVSAVVAWLCIRMLRGKPYGRSMTAGLVMTAALVLVLGLSKQVFGAVARSQVVHFLGVSESTAGANASFPEGYEGFALYALNLSLTPIGVAAALMVVASVFQVGLRLQRDTDGLV